ncbi:MAG: response regulator [Proteobacteria bacterium]|nr:response regulator [Pseudomonadota bacterium]MBU2575376.1 response regulator [Elusimicrobiota bacterium]
MPKILIVDDEPDMRLAVKNVLKLRGYEVAEAGDGPTALDTLARENIDLILLDIRLPGMDGIEVLEKARKIKSEVPVVMISGYGHIQSTVDVMKLGASEYLQKPFENVQLVHTVQKLTEPKVIVPPPPREVPAGSVPGPAHVFRGFSFRAVGLALVLLAAVFAYRFFSGIHSSYFRIYPAASSNISVLLWNDKELWAGDWLEQALYRYQPVKGALELKKKYALGNVHIGGFAVAGGNLYIADAWKKVIEKRKLDDALTLVKSFGFPGRIGSLSYDGEYLWSCDSEGTVLLHKLDSELTVAAHFRLPNRPDQIYKTKRELWSAVSSTGRLYKHNLDDKLSVAGAYALKLPLPRQPLSAFTWKGGRLWLAGDGTAEVYEAGRGLLVKAAE